MSTVPTKIIADEPMFVPEYENEGSACASLVANIPVDVAGNRRISLTSRSQVKVDCGISIDLPEGWQAKITPAIKFSERGMVIKNSPAVVDHRNKVEVLLGNVGKEIIVINHGDKFAQVEPVPVHHFEWEVVDEFVDPCCSGDTCEETEEAEAQVVDPCCSPGNPCEETKVGS